MDEKYAVYIIVIEDTEENDQRIADLYPAVMERPAGNMSNDEAQEAIREAVHAIAYHDHGIAR